MHAQPPVPPVLNNAQASGRGLLRLMQVTDSALPTGAYAFSNGLETAVKEGLITSSDDAGEYLAAYMRQACSAELPFVKSCYALPYGFHAAAVKAMLEDLDAFITVPAMSRASLTLGRNFLRIFLKLYPGGILDDFHAWLSRECVAPHYLVAYAIGVRSAGFSREEALWGCYYQTLRDQVSALVRLGGIGPLEGTRIQGALLANADADIAAAPEDYRCALTVSPLIGLMQGRHKDLYSRLFQS